MGGFITGIPDEVGQRAQLLPEVSAGSDKNPIKSHRYAGANESRNQNICKLITAFLCLQNLLSPHEVQTLIQDPQQAIIKIQT